MLLLFLRAVMAARNALGIAAQLRATKRWLRRGLPSSMAFAITSFPVPVSPWISTRSPPAQKMRDVSWTKKDVFGIAAYLLRENGLPAGDRAIRAE